MKTAKAIWRLFLFVLLSIYVVGTQTLLLPFCRGPASYIVPLQWQRGTRRIFGIKMIVEGAPVTDRQTIYVANHLSYLDITVIGSFVKASFVARGDLARWPVFGYMGKMQQSVYISRERQDAQEGKSQLEQYIRDGKSLILFAEGTSSDGRSVLPFKSSLFGLALDNASGRPIPVQPVTISLLEVDGRPAVGQEVRDLYAWHGDMTLLPHIWQVAKMNGALVKVTFHPVRESAAYTDRKALCRDCHADVAGGLEQPLARAA